MASYPAYQSTQTTTTSNSDTIAITKPTSLAVGDVMVAALMGAGTSPTAPSGWTLLGTGSQGGTEHFRAYAKIADAGDVAASDFTWSGLGAGADITGSISRFTVTNSISVTRIQASVGDSDGSADSTATATGITPLSGPGTYLIFGGSAGNIRVNSYAMATDDPSWTEAFDPSVIPALGMSYATREATTATGTITVTFASGNTQEYAALVYLPSITEVTPAAVSLTGTAYDAVVPTVVVENPVSLTGAIPSPTIDARTNAVSNVQKNSEDWTNVQKS